MQKKKVKKNREQEVKTSAKAILKEQLQWGAEKVDCVSGGLCKWIAMQPNVCPT